VLLIVNMVQKFEWIWMVIFCRIDDWMDGAARVLEIASGRSRTIRQDGADSPAPGADSSIPDKNLHFLSLCCDIINY
jgi:hypothetical protein